MSELVKATLQNITASGQPVVKVMFNPTQYTITHQAVYVEMAVPGLQQPITQFVRGDPDQLEVILFLDRSKDRKSVFTEEGLVEADMKRLRSWIYIASQYHAPPIVRFVWGDTKFDGVIKTLKEEFLLFGRDGKVQRAKATLTMRSYRGPAEQWRDIGYQSPDRTETWVVRQGDRLDLTADEAYGDPLLWRAIADENGLARLRDLVPGTVLTLPAI